MGIDYFNCEGPKCGKILNDCSGGYQQCNSCSWTYCLDCIKEMEEKFGSVKIDDDEVDDTVCKTCYHCNEEEIEKRDKEKKEQKIYSELKECKKCKLKTKFKRTCINKECKK